MSASDLTTYWAVEDLGTEIHVAPISRRVHAMASSCWCEPQADAPTPGARADIWIHRDLETANVPS